MKTLLQKVKSSNIEAIGFTDELHDPPWGLLYVQFKGGGLYSYNPFTKSQFDKFKKAKSKGKWFHKHVLNNKKYEVTKVSD